MWRFGYVYDTSFTHGWRMGGTAVTGATGRKGSVHETEGKFSLHASRRFGSLALGAVALATVGLTLMGTASVAGASGIPTGGTKTAGGTVRWAEPPQATPTYIFPFISASNESVNNISQFQYLMYRPLYMFGFPGNNKTTLNPTLSLAALPSYGDGDTTATIAMKPSYKWSDGESVTASDVLLFLNMYHAETANWYDYVPGYIPDNLKSVTVNTPTSLTMTMTKSVDPTWFTYNQLSQLTPFPSAWDVTAAGAAPGSGGCSTGTYGAAATDAACTKVYNYLAGLAGNPTGYSSSPIWSVVDGPYTIASSKGGSYSTSGAVTMCRTRPTVAPRRRR